MSNRDPPRSYHCSAPGHPPARPINGDGLYYPPHPNHRMLNPTAGHFQPSNDYNMFQDSQSPPYHLERKINNLERQQGALHADFEALKTKCNELHSKVEGLTKGGWDVKVGPFKTQAIAELKKDLDVMSRDIKEDNDVANEYENNGRGPPHMRPPSIVSIGSSSVPPHMRARNSVENRNTSQPPHLRNAVVNGTSEKNPATKTESSASNSLVTDGIVESMTKTHGPEPTPPASPTTTLRPDDPVPSIENITPNPGTDKNWTPHFLNTLAPLRPDAADKIPNMKEMKSFAPDFLRNTFGGIQWSPGLNFIPATSSPCIIRNRSYYTLDSQFEPYLPSRPGTHGAKLVPFFNENAEDHYEMPEEYGTTSDNVPLFIMRKDAAGRLRYFYFGHYSQTRWSDKLDYDRMVQCIPAKVREYWAEELSAAGRPQWITKALLNHFFPKPEYDGRLFGVSVDEGGSVMSADLSKREDKVLKDIKNYAEVLREWEKDSRMKTAMIRKEFILQAFDRADADDPPALRLWWEYLECVDWKADFYNLLVTLQARDPNYERY